MIIEYGTKELTRDFGPLTFGDAIESHRKCEEISQRDFAKMLGISAQSLCDIEKGRKIPTVTRAAKIANQINEPEKTWIRLALQDMLRKGNLNYTVSIA
ncbi:MAG: helix-turn-helix transcriptional regulator [Desulfobacteraceae bacterium]|nr:helix-turn-helix transcriptional regulator [Desulfobacteraceae bacterium]